jgi:hypothetical protein
MRLPSPRCGTVGFTTAPDRRAEDKTDGELVATGSFFWLGLHNAFAVLQLHYEDSYTPILNPYY